MAKRTIRHVFYRYADADGRQQVAYQGDTVDLPAEAIKRGETLGAFDDGSDPITAASSEPVPSSRVTQEMQPPPDDGDYESWDKPRLQAEADRRGLTVEGSGANGNVLKEDLVAALEENDIS